MLPEQSRFQNTVDAVRRWRHDGQLPVRGGLLHFRRFHATIVHVARITLQAYLPRAPALRRRVRPSQRRLQEPLLRASEAVSNDVIVSCCRHVTTVRSRNTISVVQLALYCCTDVRYFLAGGRSQRDTHDTQTAEPHLSTR